MSNVIKKVKAKLQSGVGELIGFVGVSFFLLFFIVVLCALIQLISGFTDINKAVTAASRSAAVCVSYDDALEQSRRVAETCITNPNVSDITTEIDYLGDSEEWEAGGVIVVTVKAYVKTIDPLILSGYKANRVVVTIENTAKNGIDIPESYGTAFATQPWQTLTKTSEMNKLASKSKMPYDSDGYYKINDRYVVSCTSMFGKVGDYVDFKLSNGITIPAIIGNVRSSSGSSGSAYGGRDGKVVLTFIINENAWSGAKPGTKKYHSEWNSRVSNAINIGVNYFK